MKTIDLRSDTVTKPSEAMKKAMFNAEVGDDVYGDDPTANKLEEMMADITGKESVLFAPSGTMSNLTALMSHCQRGDEYIVGQNAHTYKYEGGGAAVLGSIQPQPIDLENDGTLNIEKIEKYIKPNDYHFADTKLICIENTHSGIALPVAYHEKISNFAKRKNLSLHLDGARIFNAAVFDNINVKEITKYYDSISICFSKGLGTPAGSVLCGKKDFIKTARRWRKVVGGGMRQIGLLAAACIYALENNIDRLKEDHENAKLLTNGLSEINELQVEHNERQTNMVFVNIEEQYLNDLKKYFRSNNIIISFDKKTRLVTHLDVNKEDILKVIRLFKDFFKK